MFPTKLKVKYAPAWYWKMIHPFASGLAIKEFIFSTGQDPLTGILPKNQTVYILAVSHPEDKACNHP